MRIGDGTSKLLQASGGPRNIYDGRGQVRAVPYQPALAALRSNAPLCEVYKGLLAAGDGTRAGSAR